MLPLGFTERNLFHPPDFFPHSQIHGRASGPDRLKHSSKDKNDPPVPKFSGLSVGAMSLCPFRAHLLVLSRLPVTPPFSGPLSPSHLPVPVCPGSPFSPMCHLPGCPQPAGLHFKVTPGPLAESDLSGSLAFVLTAPPTLLLDV